MGLFETEAIILRTYRLAEADKIVVCLTRKSGLIRGVARGARRLRSRFGASLEPFTHVNLSYFEKEGRELVSLRHAEILRSHFGLARSAEAFAVLEYLGELAAEFAPPHQADEKLFRMVRACVEAAAQAPDQLGLIACYYEVWILKLSGLLPDVRACGACGRGFRREGERVFFNFESSLRCVKCTGGGWAQLSPEAFARLCAAQTQGPAEWAGEGTQAGSVRAEAELSGLTRRLIERALEREPRGRRAHTLALSADGARRALKDSPPPPPLPGERF